jgi:hypothetical protein
MVDLISYTVSALDPVPLLHEAAPGSGQLCGSTFLNRIFAKYMRDRFENDPEWDDEVMIAAMERFDGIKRKFEGNLDKVYIIPVHGLKDNRPAGIKRGILRLSGKDVSDIFEPVISEILKLVKDHIRATKKNVKEVLLVGGFGSNVYLRNRLQEEVGRAIEVKVGREPYVPDRCSWRNPIC